MTMVSTGQMSVQSTRAFAPALAFVVVSILIAAPILAHLYLPLVDLPNHIARHYLATSMPVALEPYYSYSFGLVPNSAVDYLWLLWGGEGDPTRFSQISMALAAVAFLAATMVLSRGVWGGWSLWPAAVGLVAYHACFFWGFQNYVVSLPLVLFGTAFWLGSERMGLALRLILIAPFVFLLFLMHFFAFAALAVIVFGRELQRIIESGAQWPRPVGRALVLSLPFLATLFYLMVTLMSGPPSPAGSMTLWGGLRHRLEAFASIALSNERVLPLGLTLTGALVIALFGLFIVYLRRETGSRLVLNPAMRGPLFALLALVVCAPLWLNGVAFVHVRFGVLLAAVFLAATQWRDLPNRGAMLLGCVILTVIAARSVQFERYAAHHDREVRQLITLAETLPPGARLLPIRDRELLRDQRLWHVAGYAVVRANVFVPTLFQGVHGLQVRHEWSDHATPALHPVSVEWLEGLEEPIPFQLRFAVNWQDKFNYAIMLDEDRTELEAFPELQGNDRLGRFTLYEIARR